MIRKICLYIFLFFCLILNVVFDSNINNYIQILNICFNKQIVLDCKIYVLICFIIALISVFIVTDTLLVLFKKQKGNKGIKFKSEDGTHGTSTWLPEKEVKEILGINNEPGIILGKLKGDIVKLPFKSYFNKNICVFGSSRKYENN